MKQKRKKEKIKMNKNFGIHFHLLLVPLLYIKTQAKANLIVQKVNCAFESNVLIFLQL